MEHRHLLPDEIDLLVDGEEGFGVAPLVAHVERCDRCRAELSAQQGLVAQLEQLPHLAPSPLFASRVMSKVQVFEPWHVAALNTVLRFVPRSKPARAMALAASMVIAVTLTAASLWVATRADGLIFLGTVALERFRGAGVEAMNGLIGATIGQAGAAALPVGGGMTAAIGALVLTVAAAAFGIRQLAVASRRRRE